MKFEACSYMLWFFYDNDSMQSLDKFKEVAISQMNYANTTLMNVIQTPIVASACSNMFPTFIATIHYLMTAYPDGEDLKFFNVIF